MKFQRVSATVGMMFNHCGLDTLHVRVVADERLSDDCVDCFRYGLLLLTIPTVHWGECLCDLGKGHWYVLFGGGLSECSVELCHEVSDSYV